MSDRDELALLAFQSAHSLDQGDAYRVVDALWAAGWRKKPERAAVEGEIKHALSKIIGWWRLDPQREINQRWNEGVAEAADAILALMDGLSDE